MGIANLYCSLEVTVTLLRSRAAGNCDHEARCRHPALSPPSCQPAVGRGLAGTSLEAPHRSAPGPADPLSEPELEEPHHVCEPGGRLARRHPPLGRRGLGAAGPGGAGEGPDPGRSPRRVAVDAGPLGAVLRALLPDPSAAGWPGPRCAGAARPSAASELPVSAFVLGHPQASSSPHLGARAPARRRGARSPTLRLA